ncbi:MAG: Cof-type HAD-IIB family hydrolase [Erysipelotrichaceae bacterium]|nr:Cof-type HAD-IIB family hydrolase [Erysipelotrichaceae bacterium]
MKKLFFCDIDGTLLDGARQMNDVSFKTRYAVKELMKENYVFIASGRCRGLLGKQIMSLEPNGYILCNGAYASLNGEEIFAEYFSSLQLEKIRQAVRNNNGFYILEALDEMYVDSLTSPSFLKFMEIWGQSFLGFKEEGDIEAKCLISMIGFFNKEDMDKAGKELKDYVDLAPHKYTDSFDVNIKGINKGTATKRVIEYLNIPLEDTYAFGDGINDLEMLQSVGHPVIVDNCSEELKHYGFEETDDVLDEGFYNYLVVNKLIKAL